MVMSTFRDKVLVSFPYIALAVRYTRHKAAYTHTHAGMVALTHVNVTRYHSLASGDMRLTFIMNSIIPRKP